MFRSGFNRWAPYLSAVLFFLSFVPFSFHWVLAYVALVPIFLAFEELRIRDFWISGFLFWMLALYWIPRTLNSYGKTGWIVAFLAYLLLALYLSLYFVLWGVVFRIFRNVWVAAFAFVLLEWLRLHLLYGFPLFFIAHTQADVPFLIQTASVGGQWLVGLGVLLVNASIARAKRWLPLVVGLIIVANGVLYFGYKGYPLPVRVALVQPNLSEKEKWEPAKKMANIERVLKMVESACRADVDLIITPETAVPVYWKIDSETFYILKKLGGCSVPVVLGVVGVKFEGGEPKYTNNMVVLEKAAEIATYTKRILVPFGEFVPLRKILVKVLPFIQFPADFVRGDKPPLVRLKDMSFVAGICYEMAFPNYIDRYAKKADFLVNITNDMWFGKTIAPYAHLWAAIFRAVETRRYLYRCANSGISAVVDPWGRVRKSLGLMRRGILFYP